MRALHQFIAHGEALAAASGRAPHPAPGPAPGGAPRAAGRGGEPRAPRRNRDPRGAASPLRTEEEAVAAAAALGGPVAVKAAARPTSPTRAILGLVHLGVRAPTRCGRPSKPVAGRWSGTGGLRGGDRRRDGAGTARAAARRPPRPAFRPVVVVGDGGRYVEAMPDLGVLMPPFDTGDVRRVLGRLRLAPVLAGTRGEPPLALAGLCRGGRRAGRVDGGRAAGGERRRESLPGREHGGGGPRPRRRRPDARLDPVGEGR